MIALVTDRRRLAPGSAAEDRLVELVGSAAEAGVDLIQVRERDLEAAKLVALVRRCRRAVQGTRTRVVVNERADVALAGDAHGVHLRSDSVDAAAARTFLGDRALIGRSVHGSEEAATVSDAGAVDYLIFGTLFETVSKAQTYQVASLDQLEEACRRSAVPVLAIGGMTVERAAVAVRAGAAGIAGIGLFIPPPGRPAKAHLHGVVAGLRRVFDTCGALS